jgi:hypothetical protein
MASEGHAAMHDGASEYPSHIVQSSGTLKVISAESGARFSPFTSNSTPASKIALLGHSSMQALQLMQSSVMTIMSDTFEFCESIGALSHASQQK